MARLAVWVVTYRRPLLLQRALHSLLAQTVQDWKAYVVNDDPEDERVEDLIKTINDSRISLYTPLKKRGASASFNLAFNSSCCDYASLLEDDNWWEPEFLETMLERLSCHPEVDIAVSNERIWKETTTGDWLNTGRTIWPEGPDRLFTSDFDFACGSAKLCNSSMMIRRSGRPQFLTPDDIPVDVTEHFRERCVTQPILLVNNPLANYAETLKTYRDTSGITWEAYQIMLTGSCFRSISTSSQKHYSHELIAKEAGRCTPRVTALATTALFFPEARMVWSPMNWKQWIATLLTWTRRLPKLIKIHTFLRSPKANRHMRFLLDSPYNIKLSKSHESHH